MTGRCIELNHFRVGSRHVIVFIYMPKQTPKQTKICPQCKRPFENRKSWKLRGQWEQVVYCSDRCRRATNT